jgi:hypothetical protein
LVLYVLVTFTHHRLTLKGEPARDNRPRVLFVLSLREALDRPPDRLRQEVEHDLLIYEAHLCLGGVYVHVHHRGVHLHLKDVKGEATFREPQPIGALDRA